MARMETPEALGPVCQLDNQTRVHQPLPLDHRAVRHGLAASSGDLKTLYVPETKRILIDADLADLKKRRAEAHEVGHSLIERHEPYMHGDQKVTLSVACYKELEAEANFAAGRLLFLRDGFRDRLLAAPVDFDAIKALSRTFGKTITTTLWRAVEAMDVPAVGLI